MIETGLQQLITSDQRFSTIAATRLYPVLLPTESPLPAATYQVIAVKALYDLTARVNVSQMRFQVDAWGNRYTDVKNVASAIISILDNYSGPLSDGSQVFGIQLRNAFDAGFEHEALTYRVLIEFDIQFASAS